MRAQGGCVREPTPDRRRRCNGHEEVETVVTGVPPSFVGLSGPDVVVLFS